ncbi:MAG: hypothetical protein JW969_12490 [Spirochaetales bacterium]|nr:hypothetical protein [Spirochaetales bacterium]
MKNDMTCFKKIALISFIILLASIWGCVGTPESNGDGTESAPSLPDLILGDFESDKWEVPMGKWIAEDDTPNQGTSTAVISRVPGRDGSAGAIRLDYTLGSGYQYRYGLVKLMMDEPQDLSWYSFKPPPW